MVAVIVVSLTTVASVASTPSIRRLAPSSKPVPVTLTSVPPVDSPEVGAMAVTVGSGAEQVLVASSYCCPASQTARGTQAWAEASNHSESWHSAMADALAPASPAPADGLGDDDVTTFTRSSPPMRMRTMITAMTT